ncbi:winged helix-turn-helix domain-containing protein [Bradyrhizobium sp. URHC0002]
MRSTAAFGRLEKFHLEPELDVGRAVQRPDAARPLFKKRTEPASATPTEVSFGPFRLLRTQFLCWKATSPPLGSRALEILIALLERHRELVSNQNLMARVWPNVFVEPTNLTVHMSALRRALRDGQDGNRFIVDIPGRGYCFVASCALNRTTSLVGRERQNFSSWSTKRISSPRISRWSNSESHPHGHFLRKSESGPIRTSQKGHMRKRHRSRNGICANRERLH